MSLPDTMIAPAPDFAAHSAKAGVRSGCRAKMMTRSDVSACAASLGVRCSVLDDIREVCQDGDFGIYHDAFACMGVRCESNDRKGFVE